MHTRRAVKTLSISRKSYFYSHTHISICDYGIMHHNRCSPPTSTTTKLFSTNYATFQFAINPITLVSRNTKSPPQRSKNVQFYAETSHSPSMKGVLRWSFLITSDKGGGKCVWPRLSVCLSICLLARLLKNACVDLDEMSRVDRYRDMDELINFWARSGL